MTVYEFLLSSEDLNALKKVGLIKYKAQLYPVIYNKYLLHAVTKRRTEAIRAACEDMNCSIRVGFKVVELMEQEL